MARETPVGPLVLLSEHYSTAHTSRRYPERPEKSPRDDLCHPRFITRCSVHSVLGEISEIQSRRDFAGVLHRF